MSHRIRCRARIAGRCLDGQPTRAQFGDDLSMRADGTYDGESIVCDACYMQLMPFTASGRGLYDELDAAIEQVRGQQ